MSTAEPPESLSPVFLHVGCGSHNKRHTPFANQSWREIRLDINPAVQPDVIGTMTEMESVMDSSVDAVYSSHNIEHLYPHEVPIALAEFDRVLKPDGFVLLTCPDLQSVCNRVANNQLTTPLYHTIDGLPIAALDILYGYRASLKAGNLFMAHRCGFTAQVLLNTLSLSGFDSGVQVRPEKFDLWALGIKSKLNDTDRLKKLCSVYLPQK